MDKFDFFEAENTTPAIRMKLSILPSNASQETRQSFITTFRRHLSDIPYMTQLYTLHMTDGGSIELVLPQGMREALMMVYAVCHGIVPVLERMFGPQTTARLPQPPLSMDIPLIDGKKANECIMKHVGVVRRIISSIIPLHVLLGDQQYLQLYKTVSKQHYQNCLAEAIPALEAYIEEIQKTISA